MGVEFRLLGEITASLHGGAVPIGYAQLRAVLAVLLVEVNRRVPVEVLVDRVWGARKLPARPRGAVQHSVTLLRKALAIAPDVTIDWSSAGYQLSTGRESVDLHRFRDQIGEARTASDDATAADLFGRALALWQGEPFAGLDLPWFNSMRDTLSRQRHAAELDLVDVRLRRGEHTALLAELADLVAEHPLDERLAGQYLLALYRSGRQAAALEHYDVVRKRLAEQLGADPSPPLRRLHQLILVGDVTLAAPGAATAAVIELTGGTVGSTGVAAGPSLVVPRQLPARPRLFAGRGPELARLTAALDQQAGSDGPVAVSVIAGAGGIGKTWLALHWAYQRLDQFPDGHLHVNLRGFDPVGQPMSAATAVRGFLDALGVSPDATPVDPDAQAALYRSLVAGRRMLILLDNARDAGQVEPLLPGGGRCTVLITSRRPLPGLVAAHGAYYLPLDVLSDREAADLLTAHLGARRPAAEPDAAAGLVAHCAGLPLAVSIVAARAVTHPDLLLAVLAEELRDHAGRLDALDGGDATVNLRSVLSWSCDELSAGERELWEQLGLAPGADLTLAAAASLAALPVAEAKRSLGVLCDLFLVQEYTPGRYRLHDLVRLYAAEQARGHQPERARVAALRRLVDFYLHSAYAGDRLLDPSRPRIPPPGPIQGSQPLRFADPAVGLAWFTAEHANLLASQRAAADLGCHTAVWQLAWNLGAYHFRHGHLHDARRSWEIGLASAGLAADPVGLIYANQRLGAACGLLGLLAEASWHVEESITLAVRESDVRSQAHGHHNLAWIWDERGDFVRALGHATRALTLFEQLGDSTWHATALNSAGWCHARLGRYDAARAHCEAALDLLRPLGHPEGEAVTWDSLGYIAHHTGRYAEARDHYQQALRRYAELGHPFGRATTMEKLGHTLQALGQHDEARRLLREVLTLYRAQHRALDADRIRHHLVQARLET